MIRAFAPKPLAWTTTDKGRLKLHGSRLPAADDVAVWLLNGGVGAESRETWSANPGTVLVGREGKKLKMLVVTGDGLLEVTELQPENRKPMAAGDFLNGSRIQSGARLGEADSG